MIPANERINQLLQIIRDAPHGFMCLSSYVPLVPGQWQMWEFPSAPNESKCNCWKKKAIQYEPSHE